MPGLLALAPACASESPRGAWRGRLPGSDMHFSFFFFVFPFNVLDNSVPQTLSQKTVLTFAEVAWGQVVSPVS